MLALLQEQLHGNFTAADFLYAPIRYVAGGDKKGIFAAGAGLVDCFIEAFTLERINVAQAAVDGLADELILPSAVPGNGDERSLVDKIFLQDAQHIVTCIIKTELRP